MPQAEAALSPAPPATTTLEPNPHFSASSARRVPARSVPSTRPGICSTDRPVASSNSLDQARLPVSSQLVPAESDMSERYSPVSHSRRKSLGSSTLATFAKVSASLFFTQASFGAVKPGKTILPVSARKRGSASRIAASAWLRVSFQRMQGRSTRSFASMSVAPCMWPESPIPLTAASSAGCSALSAAIASSAARSQSPGACSDQPECGRCTVRLACPTPITFCASSISIALMPDVPRSSPRYMSVLHSSAFRADCPSRICRYECAPGQLRPAVRRPWPSTPGSRCALHGRRPD